MSSKHVVVDGSNIATEGRSMPSLAQLDQAVREFMLENPDDVVTVVVDASFGHRINASEVDMYEEAEAAGELVSPPAGAIGRGDAFLLRIADKTGATVLSNDSFQEFHGEHEWLFDKGRLIGGKPVPGVGWIFTPRTPVRGPKSREAVKEAKRTRKGDGETASAIPGLDLAAERARGKGKGKKTVERAIAVATEEAVEPKVAKRRRRRSKGGAPPAEPVNEPLAFITFIAAHPLGAEVEGTVDSFASHGAFVTVEGARCYLPLSAMGDPPPRSGREIFARGDTRRFVIQALDPQRRGVELALPGFVRIAGWPTDETVEAEIAGAADEPAPPAEPARKRVSRRGQAAAAPEVEAADGPAGEPVARKPAKRARKAAEAVEAQGEPAALPIPTPVPTPSQAPIPAQAEAAAAPASARPVPRRTKKAAAKAPSVERRQPARPQKTAQKAAAAEPSTRRRATRSRAPDAQPGLTPGQTLPAAKAPGRDEPAAGVGKASKSASKKGAGASAKVAGAKQGTPTGKARSGAAASPAKTSAPSGGANKTASTRTAKAAGTAEGGAKKRGGAPAKGTGVAKATKATQPARAAKSKKAAAGKAAPPAEQPKAPAKAAKAAKAVKIVKAAKTTKTGAGGGPSPPGTAARAAQAGRPAGASTRTGSLAPAERPVKASKKARPSDRETAAYPPAAGRSPAS